MRNFDPYRMGRKDVSVAFSGGPRATEPGSGTSAPSRAERPWLRSLLFVPGHKSEWIRKATGYGADALVIDLEDSVPEDAKAGARTSVRHLIPDLAPSLVFVRVNAWNTGHLLEDVLTVATAEVAGLLLSKTSSPGDVYALDHLLAEVEARQGIGPGHFEILPLLETAASIESAFEILSASSRIARVAAVPGLTPDAPGDLHRSLGIDATVSGEEMLYVSGRSLVAARAAGVPHILGGMTVDVANLDLLRESLHRAKRLGARGSLAIHPSHIAVINEIFAPDAAQIAVAQELVRCLADAIARGDAAAKFNGHMVDTAHAKSALDVLDRAAQCGIDVGEVPALDEWAARKR
jgi:citrate lyase subunit beta / citryl-CoA lyase